MPSDFLVRAAGERGGEGADNGRLCRDNCRGVIFRGGTLQPGVEIDQLNPVARLIPRPSSLLPPHPFRAHTRIRFNGEGDGRRGGQKLAIGRMCPNENSIIGSSAR